MLARPDYTRTRWNGWGSPDKSFSLDERPAFREYLRKRLDLYHAYPSAAVELEAISLPASRLTDKARLDLGGIVGKENVREDPAARISHSLDKSYDSLAAARRGELEIAPDAVLYPAASREVREILAWAGDAGAAIIPFGGGTGVAGGIVPLKAPDQECAVSVDMGRLDKILSVDVKSQSAVVEPGIRGPVLEESLRAHGLTLGHFPQSFEFSTLGGWVATRSAGFYYAGSRSIDEKILGLWVETPVGPLESRITCSRSAGPELLQMLTGSEGCLGIVALAEMRLMRKPETRRTLAYFLESFRAGTEVVRELVQSDLPLAMVRLSDEEETSLTLALQRRPAGLTGYLRRGLSAAVRRGRGMEAPSLLFVGLLGSAGRVSRVASEVSGLVESLGGLQLEDGFGREFDRDRFLFPYVRDALIEVGILVESYETAVPWTRIQTLHGNLSRTVTTACEERSSACILLANLAHACAAGASLNWTVLARAVPGEEGKLARALRRAATEAILRGGGTLSHSRGIGSIRAEWMMQEHGPSGIATLRSLKGYLDPRGILNPGKLLPYPQSAAKPGPKALEP